jgi:putative thioredoxin
MDKPFISMSGNVAQAPAAKAADSLIRDSDTRNFMADVIDASRQVPVLVDFWAPWCGPCKQLTPALEKIVREAKGAVKLVKINVDENQQLAAQMRIQSIPAVFAFVNGQPVDGFMGALPEGDLKKFVSRLTGSEVGAEIDAILDEADTALAAKNYKVAGQIYADILGTDRENVRAIAGLARAQIGNGDLDGARATLGLVPPAKAADPAITSARAALDLALTPVDTGEIARLSKAVEQNPADHQSRHDLAVSLNAAGRREEALDHLLSIVRQQRGWNDEAARKQLVKSFEAWGPKDELTIAGRKRLSSILFS